MVDPQPELFRLERATQRLNGIQTVPISNGEVDKILNTEEGHFVDLKAIDTSPAGLTRAIAALSNAEGGELFIGVDEDNAKKKRTWRGFANQEAANAHLQVFDELFPLGTDYRYDFFGTFPGHVTPENILQERFARNASIVRLINKFPNPPNKDVGEGLNTAFQAMREMKLKDPIITQEGGYVKVVLRHEPLATPEEIILEYLRTRDEIANREAREICYIGSENKMKRILQQMVTKGLIEPVPERTRYNAAYRLPKRWKQSRE